MDQQDTGRIYAHDMLSSQATNLTQDTFQSFISLGKECEDRLLQFLLTFVIDDCFIYREQMIRNLNLEQYYLEVSLNHLAAFDETLAGLLQENPLQVLPLFEEAAKRVAFAVKNASGENLGPLFKEIQILISSSSNITPIRDLGAKQLNKLVRIAGITVSASSVIAKPKKVHLMCKQCRSTKFITINDAFDSPMLPRTCSGADNSTTQGTRCPIDPYVIVAQKCECVDQQTLKLQEAPDVVPVGELPRHVVLIVDRSLVNRVVPGKRISLSGIYYIHQAKGKRTGGEVAIRTPYIRVVGLQIDQDDALHSRNIFTEEQERDFLALSQSNNLYARFANSIAPSIFGHDDIKKAIACLLFGGSSCILPDKVKLRGDINVLLLGDPGTAKSQFLKFTEKIAPISVYTSGKGSSAAGLTASVVRDPASGEFYLEGGAMVLADGGVVCIDEFDKMHDEDRVAIHEAMEQQTISIAKAGITTILNSRTSVLAAANPVFGRYDELKTPGENIDFSSTILSRFDMIFIVKDDHDPRRDTTLARHVLGVHMGQTNDVSGELDVHTMKNYVRYCRSSCTPRLSVEAAELLSNHYVSIRSEVHNMELNATQRSSIPITVRQLEAIIRISESLAKMTLSSVVNESHVKEALRLFRNSTIHAAQSGHSLEGMTRPDLIRQVEQVEHVIRRRVPIGSSISYRALVNELTESKGFPEHVVAKAIDVQLQQGKLLLRQNRKVLIRQH